jgi:glycerol-3-phosphate dehydrogenase
MRRDPAALAATIHDVIVVGGGIYGAMLALEATRRGLRALLLERDDFGGATSWNSLRIAHGGLRYLQTLDLRRYHESVAERRWLLTHFPELVRPLPCLMPLYNDGARRTSILGVALALNDRLSRTRNAGLPESQWLPDGSMLDSVEVKRSFGEVDQKGLRGGALWYDGVITSSSRLLMEALRWAESGGASAQNYVECTGFSSDGGRVIGVRARDRHTEAALEFRGRVVINAAGPWCRDVAALAGPAPSSLFRPSLAFNVLLDREPLAASALAVRPRRRGGRIYFMYPRQGRVLAGTFHAPWLGPADHPTPAEEHVAAFLTDLNDAVPGWNLRRDEVIRVLSGLLPASREGTAALAVREVFHDHGAHGGLKGLYSVCGVKYTTARLVAEKALTRILGGPRRDVEIARPAPVSPPDLDTMVRLAQTDRKSASELVDRLNQSEAVLNPEDLLSRRTDWGLDPRRIPELQTLVTNAGP